MRARPIQASPWTDSFTRGKRARPSGTSRRRWKAVRHELPDHLVRPAWIFDLHRFLGGLALIFTGLHVGAILLDGYVHFSLVNVLVPFTGSWHRTAVAWGITAFYLLLAVELTSLARAHISKRLWRRVHFASFALFVSSTVHALTAGTDARSPLFLGAVAAVVAVVTILSAMRIVRFALRAGPSGQLLGRGLQAGFRISR